MPRRVIKANSESMAGLEVGEHAVRLGGNDENFVYIDESGVYIVGKISLLTQPEDIRVGTSYNFPTAYKGQLPSTAVNPQPMFIANSPVGGFASIAEEVASLLGELI